ncbi:hypothetical protein M2277_004094 [Paenibacillus sp. LBL]|nr:hypothetical protein [Paenibacillus sp. LBL]
MLKKKTSLILTAIISLVLLFSSSVYAYVSLKTGYLSPSIRFAPQGFYLHSMNRPSSALRLLGMRLLLKCILAEMLTLIILL